MHRTYEVQDETFHLLAKRAIYWPDQKAILISDIHLGKIQHFRKYGIALPAVASFDNYARLQELVLAYEPARVIFLGDLFHSDMNTDWLRFADFVSTFSDVSFELVLGNHDILGVKTFETALHQVHVDTLTIKDITLSHEPVKCGGYNLCGHIHPGAILRGKGKQRLRLPCFYFGEQTGILPAFGTFTGLHILDPKEAKAIYVIAEDEVVEV